MYILFQIHYITEEQRTCVSIVTNARDVQPSARGGDRDVARRARAGGRRAAAGQPLQADPPLPQLRTHAHQKENLM